MIAETALVIAIVVVASLLAFRYTLRRAGLLRGQDKPGCGCGTCQTKRVQKYKSRPNRAKEKP